MGSIYRITIFSPYNFSFKHLFYESYVIDNLFFLTIIRSENFYGDDAIHVSASNKNGKNDMDVPVSVEPVNDPPVIKIPKFIILKSNEDESLIFDKAIDKFEFSVGDPDLLGYPGIYMNILFSHQNYFGTRHFCLRNSQDLRE